MKRKYIIAGMICGFLCITGIFYSCAYNNKTAAVLVPQQITENKSLDGSPEVTGEPSEDDTVLELPDNKEQPSEQATVYVHICGAVIKPGVYQVEEGARLFDLIELSGGLTKEAAGDYINQAEPVADGQRIYIPTTKEVEDLTADEFMEGNRTDSVAAEASALININTADANQLMSLPGIGESKANSIIEYRNANGKFKLIEDLMNIPGIKEGLFNQISSKIIIN